MPDLLHPLHDLTSPRPAPVELDALAQWRRVQRALQHWRAFPEDWAACEPAWPASFLQEEAALGLGAAPRSLVDGDLDLRDREGRPLVDEADLLPPHAFGVAQILQHGEALDRESAQRDG